MQSPQDHQHPAHREFRVVFHGLRVWDSGEIIDVALPPAPLDHILDDTGLFADHRSSGPSDAATIDIDASGLTIAPGLCDPHVHFRDPGQRDKEDMLSGCRSAAAGGFTSVLLMPNTSPAMDGKRIRTGQDHESVSASDAHGRQEVTQAGFDSVIDYVQHYAQSHQVTLPAKYLLSVCASVNRAGVEASDPGDWKGYLRDSVRQLTPGHAMREHPVVAISDDGSAVTSQTLADVGRHARRYSLPILDHCEHHDSGVMNEGQTSRSMGLPGIPASTELKIVARDIEFARSTGIHMHLQHVSTALAFDAIRKAKAEGLPISCETAPHYLALCDEDVKRFGTMAKMNPPLRSAADRDATLAAIADGTVDMLATDHAPHTILEKERSMMESPNGIIGLETAYGVCHRVLVDGGVIDDARLIELMSLAPAKLMGVEAPDVSALLNACDDGRNSRSGRRMLDLSKVNDAHAQDFTMLDTTEAWVVESQDFHSKARNTPFQGMSVSGRAQMTVVDAAIAFNRLPVTRLMQADR
ncbi:dihydroorotase [Bifidobacterium aquikefiricola]|uniref:Dihydroorotase n=1 Tax=Bifidobacterium aquikefiricola TaxID=3059038 RepID=A0AB39U952_9BIFI